MAKTANNNVTEPLSDNPDRNFIGVVVSRCRRFTERFHNLWLFAKASMVANFAGWIDMGIGFVLFTFIGMPARYATALGAVAGGIVNCYINYKWTFKAKDCSALNVAVKYVLIWVGSILLNSYGTEFFTRLFENSVWLVEMGVKPAACYGVARLGVSLIVSVFWNLLLQRYFVYRYNSFDPFLDGLIQPVVKRFKHNN